MVIVFLGYKAFDEPPVLMKPEGSPTIADVDIMMSEVELPEDCETVRIWSMEGHQTYKVPPSLRQFRFVTRMVNSGGTGYPPRAEMK